MKIKRYALPIFKLGFAILAAGFPTLAQADLWRDRNGGVIGMTDECQTPPITVMDIALCRPSEDGHALYVIELVFLRDRTVQDMSIAKRSDHSPWAAPHPLLMARPICDADALGLLSFDWRAVRVEIFERDGDKYFHLADPEHYPKTVFS